MSDNTTSGGFDAPAINLTGLDHFVIEDNYIVDTPTHGIFVSMLGAHSSSP